MHLETQAHWMQSPFLEHFDASPSLRLIRLEIEAMGTAWSCRIQSQPDTNILLARSTGNHEKTHIVCSSLSFPNPLYVEVHTRQKTWTSHNKSAFALWCFLPLVGHNNRFSARFVQSNKRNNYSMHTRPRVLRQAAFYQPALKILYSTMLSMTVRMKLLSVYFIWKEEHVSWRHLLDTPFYFTLNRNFVLIGLLRQNAQLLFPSPY